MSDSKLICYTKISPSSSARSGKIVGISVHTMAGNLSVEGCGEVFQARAASSNYGIGSDGRIGLYVRENRRAWCTSSKIDHQVVSIEVASLTAKEPYQCSIAAWNSLVALCVDICQRNGISKLVWDEKKKALVTGFSANASWHKSCNIVPHRWFAAKSCPGSYLFWQYGRLATEVNAKLAADKAQTTKAKAVEVEDMTEKETNVAIQAAVTPLEKRLAEQEAKNAEQETIIASLQKKLDELTPVIYNTLDEIKKDAPWAYEVIADKVQRGIIKGNGHGKLGLTISEIRQLMFAEREEVGDGGIE